MALSPKLRAQLVIVAANSDLGKELADAIEAAVAGTSVLAANNNFAGNNNFSGTNTHTGLERFKRISGVQGTPLVAGDVALSAGFGTTASPAPSGTDMRFSLTITSAGTGQGANPTATLTFKDGTWTTAPVAVACRAGGSQPGVQFQVTTTATTLVLTFLGTPVAAETYSVMCHVVG